jgi:hypothetical protein
MGARGHRSCCVKHTTCSRRQELGRVSVGHDAYLRSVEGEIRLGTQGVDPEEVAERQDEAWFAGVGYQAYDVT